MTIYLNELQTALEAAGAGAAVVAEKYGQNVNTRIKDSSQSLVTDADLAAEKAIIDVLKNRSDYGILSEESGLSAEGKGPCGIIKNDIGPSVNSIRLSASYDIFMKKGHC